MRRSVIQWLPVGLCCIAAVYTSALSGTLTRVQGLVVVALILPALVLMLYQLGTLNREWQEVNEAMDLLERWRTQRDRLGPKDTGPA